MNNLQEEIKTELDLSLLECLSSNSNNIEALIDDCVKEFGTEYTAKLIIYARDNNYNNTNCLKASVYLIKHLKQVQFAKFLFTRRLSKTGGVIKDLKDIIFIVNFYLHNELTKRNTESIKDIPYPNSMRKGLRSALENFKWLEFIEYYDSNAEGQIKLKDIIKYFHPNPKKSVATSFINLRDYLNHFNDKNKYSKEIQKAMDSAVENQYEIDVFHAILYDMIKTKESTEEVTNEQLNMNVDFKDVENIRNDINSIIIKPNVF
jgi:predicted RND superfamily exporter protein